MAKVHTFRDLLSSYACGERDFVGSELDEDPEYDLSAVKLDGVDLSQSFIVAIFRGASLRGAKFHEANIKTCDFREADLSGADFTGAALCATMFDGAVMAGADFAGASCHSYVLQSGERPTW